MKAMLIEEHGSAEVLKWGEISAPSPGVGEVLVKVHACGINHLDIWVRRGDVGSRVPPAHVLGTDISGTVAALGTEVNGTSIGDRVVIMPIRGCGHCEECHNGYPNVCRRQTTLGNQTHGGYAGYISVPASELFPISDSLTFEAAASIPVAFLTAWNMLVTKAKVISGESVLIMAAGSGVGSAAVQIANLCGARVIAAASTDEKLELAKRLGASETINYSQDNLKKAVSKLTGSRGVDVIIEHTGQERWDECIKSLARKGRLIICGATSGYEGMTDLRYLFSKELQIMGAYGGTMGEFRRVIELVSGGLLKPVVDRVMPLAEAAEAHRLIEGRKVSGKLVLKVI